MICVTHHIACACREAAHAEEIARLTRELDAARAHRTIAVRERDIALRGNDALVARLTDALEARDRAVREYLAACDVDAATFAAYDVDSATIAADEVSRRHAAWMAAGERCVATLAALREIVESDR